MDEGCFRKPADVKGNLSWENHRSSVPLRKMFKAHPGASKLPAANEFRLSDNPFFLKKVASLDQSPICPALNPMCNLQSTPVPFHIASGDNVTLRQSSKVLIDKATANGHSRNHVHAVSAQSEKPRPGRSLFLESWKTPSGALNTVVGKTNHHVSAYEKYFPIKPTASAGTCYRRSPIKAQRRCISTAEETIREEEKEVYRQLLQVVAGKSSLTAKSPSLFPSHLTRCVNSRRSLPKPLNSTTETRSVEAGVADSGNAASVVNAHIHLSQKTTLPSCLSVYASSAHLGSHIPEASRPHHDSIATLDLHSEGSDSVIDIDELKTPESPNVPFFQAELWIKELTSLYDSRARERCRQIEEQKALALQLQNQRLQEQPVQDSVDLRLRVPLEKEVPVTVPEQEKVKEPEEFPPLTEDMLKEIRRVFNSGNQDEILSEGFRLTITRKDMFTLNGLNWLNDEIINFYMNMLMERSKRKGFPKVHTFNTFFFTRMKNAGYTAVKRWTKKIDIFCMDIILVPVHLGVHWCLAAIDFRKKCVTYYDSMGGNNIEACRILLQYLKQECLDKKVKEFDTNGWQLLNKRSREIPQQMNGSDCGMFACKYADYVTKDKPITFTQQHMPYFRKRMVWEILHQKLL